MASFQVIPGQQYGDLGNGQICGLHGGLVEAGSLLARIPWSTPGTFSNLVVVNDPTGTWTLFKNDVATTIVSPGNGSDQTHTLVVSAGDVAAGPIWLHYRRTGTSKAEWQGFPVSTSLEFRADADDVQAYGLLSSAFAGGFQPPNLAGGVLGGQNYNGVSGTNLGNWYTISAIPCEITSLSMIAAFPFGFVDPTKGLRSVLRINGIAQDGTGGTPDTHIDIFATVADTLLVARSQGWTVTVAKGDRVEVLVTGLNNFINFFIVGNGVQVHSLSAGRFTLAGATSQVLVQAGAPAYFSLPGSNSVLGENVPGLGSPSFVAGRANAGPVTTMQLVGLVTYLVFPAPGGVVLTGVTRLNAATPALAGTVQSTNASPALLFDTNPLHVVDVGLGDFFDVQWSVNTLSASPQFHWAWAAQLPVPPTTPGLRLTQLPIEGVYDYHLLKPFLGNQKWVTPPPVLA